MQILYYLSFWDAQSCIYLQSWSFNSVQCEKRLCYLIPVKAERSHVLNCIIEILIEIFRVL